MRVKANAAVGVPTLSGIAPVDYLLTQFGVIAEFKGEILDHTLATLLIDEKGRVAWRADGSQWQPKEFVERMHR